MLWTLLKAVRFGDVVTYQQLAALAGSPKAARAVGGAMRSNPVSARARGDGGAGGRVGARVGACASAPRRGPSVI